MGCVCVSVCVSERYSMYTVSKIEVVFGVRECRSIWHFMDRKGKERIIGAFSIVVVESPI